jgi:hypothetical protein
MNERRAAFKQENPKAGLGESSKMMADEFKNMPDKKKEKYIKMAAADKERYEKEMKEAGITTKASKK